MRKTVFDFTEDSDACANGFYDPSEQGFCGFDWVPALQAASDWMAVNRMPVFIPPGNYRFARQAKRYLPTVEAGTWFQLIGDSRKATVLMIDQIPDEVFPDNGHKGSCLIGAGSILEAIGAAYTRDYFAVSNLTFFGVWDHKKSTTARFVGGVQAYNVDRVEVENCDFHSLTGSPAVATHCGEFTARGNRIRKATSDGIRAVGTPIVTITDNRIRWVADDAIAVHSISAGVAPRPVREAVVISNNEVMDAKGISVLGANRATVTGNHVIRGHGNGLGIGGRSAPEGAGSMVNIVVTGNHVDNTISWIDGGEVPAWPALPAYIGALTVGEGVVWSPSECLAWGSLDTLYANIDEVALSFDSPLFAGGHLGYPNTALTRINDVMDGDRPWGGSYARDGINDGYGSTAERTVGTRNFTVSGNVVTRTLKSGMPHSAWGFGEYYTWSGWIDPIVTEDAFFPSGIVLAGDVYDAAVVGNVVTGFRSGAGIYLRAIESSIDDLRFNRVNIASNVLTDNRQGLGHNLAEDQSVGVAIRGNIIDCDPYFKQPLRSAAFDGSWAEPAISGTNWSDVCLGLDTGRGYGWTIENNTFANCYCPIAPTPISLRYDAVQPSKNTMECYPAVDGYSVSNLGIGYFLIWPSGFHYRSVGSNPKEPSFRKLLFTPRTVSDVRPTTGFYAKGHVVDNIGTDIATISGWRKLESGSDNTKWVALKTA